MINIMRKCEYFLRTIDYYREIIELLLMNCKHSKVIAAYSNISCNLFICSRNWKDRRWQFWFIVSWYLWTIYFFTWCF